MIGYNKRRESPGRRVSRKDAKARRRGLGEEVHTEARMLHKKFQGDCHRLLPYNKCFIPLKSPNCTNWVCVRLIVVTKSAIKTFIPPIKK